MNSRPKSDKSNGSPHIVSLPAPANHSLLCSPKCTPSPDGKHSISATSTVPGSITTNLALPQHNLTPSHTNLTPLPSRHLSSSTQERPATLSTSSTAPDDARTKPRPASSEHGWPPRTEKPSPPTRTAPPACTPLIKRLNCYLMIQSMSVRMSHSTPSTSPAGAATRLPASAILTPLTSSP